MGQQGMQTVMGYSRGQMQALIDAEEAANDPLTTLDLVDDFMGGFTTNGQIGELGWQWAGGVTPVGLAADGASRGIYQFDTGATINTVAYMLLRSGAILGMIPGSDMFDTTFRFKLNQNDVNTKLRIGLHANVSLDPSAAGIWLEKDAADTQFFGVCRNASVQTRTAALATVDTGWHKIRIRRIDASTIGFTLDAGAEVTLTTNVPTSGLQPGAHIINTAAASKTWAIDFWRGRIVGLAR